MNFNVDRTVLDGLRALSRSNTGSIVSSMREDIWVRNIDDCCAADLALVVWKLKIRSISGQRDLAVYGRMIVLD